MVGVGDLMRFATGIWRHSRPGLVLRSLQQPAAFQSDAAGSWLSRLVGTLAIARCESSLNQVEHGEALYIRARHRPLLIRNVAS